MIVFGFQTLVSAIYLFKSSCCLSTKANWHFYDMVKIRLIMKNNAIIFIIHEASGFNHKKCSFLNYAQVFWKWFWLNWLKLTIKRMRTIYKVNHRYAIHLRFGDKFLAPVTKLMLEAKASTCSTTKENLLLYLRNCDALCDLVPFVQFKKREKHPWRSVNFTKVAG